MNCRSLSVKGRSAEVTKSTRSLRGIKSRVNSSCLRMTAFVPGVSTILISRKRSRGWVITATSSGEIVSRMVSPCLTSVTRVVVGIAPSCRTRAPSSALTRADLPALNSPTTTNRKNSSSRTIASRSASKSAGGLLSSFNAAYKSVRYCFYCRKSWDWSSVRIRGIVKTGD